MFSNKKILVLGAGGFIGSHLVKKLKNENNFIIGADLKNPEFSTSCADNFIIGDLRCQKFCETIFNQDFDEVYQLAADMGGAGYIFTGNNDANIISNSALININVAENCIKRKIGKLFYSSSACVYPEFNQVDPKNPNCSESSAYPAKPDSEYGWEKLFSERLYLSFQRNYNLNIRIARFHNIFGTECSWNNGKEKAPAALCRKVLEANDNDVIQIWGDGLQTRSFLYIDECLLGISKIMESNCQKPLNLGSEEIITINDLANMIVGISGKKIRIENISGPTGVRGRNSDNKLIFEKIKWKPTGKLYDGILKTYSWMKEKFF